MEHTVDGGNLAPPYSPQTIVLDEDFRTYGGRSSCINSTTGYGFGCKKKETTAEFGAMVCIALSDFIAGGQESKDDHMLI